MFNAGLYSENSTSNTLHRQLYSAYLVASRWNERWAKLVGRGRILAVLADTDLYTLLLLWYGTSSILGTSRPLKTGPSLGS